MHRRCLPCSLSRSQRQQGLAAAVAAAHQSGLFYSCLWFVPKTDLLPTYCGKVSVFNCGSGGVIRSGLEENRRRGKEKRFGWAASRRRLKKKKDASVCHNGEDAASAFKRCFTFLIAMLSYDELLCSALRGKWFSSVSGVVYFFLFFCFLFIAVAQR